MSHKAPGMVGKNMTFSTSSGQPWKTSEPERDKEQQNVVNVPEWERDRK